MRRCPLETPVVTRFLASRTIDLLVMHNFYHSSPMDTVYDCRKASLIIPYLATQSYHTFSREHDINPRQPSQPTNQRPALAPKSHCHPAAVRSRSRRRCLRSIKHGRPASQYSIAKHPFLAIVLHSTQSTRREKGARLKIPIQAPRAAVGVR
jgi:hypothetical protein